MNIIQDKNTGCLWIIYPLKVWQNSNFGNSAIKTKLPSGRKYEQVQVRESTSPGIAASIRSRIACLATFQMCGNVMWASV